MHRFGLIQDPILAERAAVEFISKKFADPLPGLPLSNHVLERIFYKGGIYSVYALYEAIKEGHAPNPKKVVTHLRELGIEIYSISTLALMLRSFMKGLKIHLEDIETYRLGYDFTPLYHGSEEYRHIEFLLTVFSTVANHCSEN